MKWVFYNKKLKNDFLKLGYNKNDLIYVNKINFSYVLKRSFSEFSKLKNLILKIYLKKI